MRNPLLALVLVAAAAALLTLSVSDAAPRRDQPPAQSMPCVNHGRLVPGLTTAGCPSLGISSTPLSSAAGKSGLIRGTVTEEGTGVTLESVCVTADDGAGPIDGFARTNASGVYEIKGLPISFYKVQFTDCGGAPHHLVEWFLNQPTYDQANGVPTLPEAIANASLAIGGGALGGAITDAADGIALPEICVTVLNEAGYIRATVTTDGAGQYSVEGLAPGSYAVLFDPCSLSSNYVGEWYTDHPTFVGSQRVSLGEGAKVADVNASLERGGTVSGTALFGGVPEPGICALAFDASGRFSGGAITNGQGTYEIGGLASADYAVRFEDCSTPHFMEATWYPDAHSIEDADPVHVADNGSVTNLEAVNLTMGGSIQGGVKAPGINAVSGICVEVFNIYQDIVLSGSSDASALFDVGGLPPDDYQLLFHDCREHPRYVSDWMRDGQTGPIIKATVIRGLQLTGAGATLREGGLVSGTLTGDEDGEPILGCAFAYGLGFAPIYLTDGLAGLRSTDFLGHYEMPLLAGSYKLRFADCGDGTHTPEWYDDKIFYEDGNNVSVGGVGTKHADVNAGLSLYVAGDTDCSLTVNSVDASLVLQFVAFLIEIFPCPYNGDVDFDGYITPVDAALILQFSAGLIPSLGPG